MNDLFAPDSDTNGSEPLDEGGTWLLDLVSAVDHLRRGYRPGFTVWDALAEAIEWAAATTAEDGPRPRDFGGVLTARSRRPRGAAACGPRLGSGDGRQVQRRLPVAPPSPPKRVPAGAG
jgi:hypothetical protein